MQRYGFFQALSNFDIILFAIYLFSANYVVTLHHDWKGTEGNTGIAKEVARMEVLSFAKPIAMWEESNAPVSGVRFRDYRNLALTMKAYLTEKGWKLPPKNWKLPPRTSKRAELPPKLPLTPTRWTIVSSGVFLFLSLHQPSGEKGPSWQQGNPKKTSENEETKQHDQDEDMRTKGHEDNKPACGLWLYI